MLTAADSSAATSADGVKLPDSYAVGDMVMIVNATSNALDVWPPSGGAINGGSADALKALAANMTGLYVSLGDGDWGAVLSA